MITTEIKPKEKRFLRDDIANIILTDESCRGYVEELISKALEIDINLIKDKLELRTPRINSTINSKYSIADAIYESDDIIINLEVNYNKGRISEEKNIRYISHLVLKQTKTGKINKLKPINQININNYDVFGKNEFIYRSSIMEEKYHKVRDNFIKIIDINVDKLREIPYNKIKEGSLEELLYIFVCNSLEEINSIALRNKNMDEVKEKLEKLNEDLDYYLFYDPEELRQESINEEVIKETKIEIAKVMLEKNESLDKIILYTGLSEEEINELKD